MHYRHSFHAGNFADVFKHVVLCGLLDALNRKSKPWSYLETHAGAGRYDLQGPGAVRTGEWQGGIVPLWELQNPPPGLETFLDCVRSLNPDGKLRHYPGSPLFALAHARAGDSVVLCEKVPEVAAELRQVVAVDRRVILHRRDGYEAHALLPPAQKRGLVLLDPPFERPDEFDAMAELLDRCAGRFAAGIFAAWYPLKNRHAAGRFIRRAARSAIEGLVLEFDTGAPAAGQMRGCGMLVLNPPFGFEAAIGPVLEVLVRELAQGPKAAMKIAPLKP